MALLPKKGDNVGCISAKSGAPFIPGCCYQVERVDKVIGHIYVYDDEGELTPIDFPHDVVYGKFEKVS